MTIHSLISFTVSFYPRLQRQTTKKVSGCLLIIMMELITRLSKSWISNYVTHIKLNACSFWFNTTL